ncbi:DNA repair protein RadA [bacterium]|nr:DNA repair protein RadA [bacterium]
MAEKAINVFSCSKCGAQFSKWNGRCLECGGWGTLSQETVLENSERTDVKVSPAKIVDLGRLSKSPERRILVGIDELDRVLGGGLVPGSLVLLAGEPGIGKSTLISQLANSLRSKSKTIYVSGEESALQIRNRFNRLGCDLKRVLFIGETNIEKIAAAAKEAKPALLIVDSVQTVYTSTVTSEAGSINQIRASTVSFLQLAKENNITIILTGHITKDGQVAGPKSLEHIVDTVIYLESELKNNYRLLRATKNRFGSVNEVGVFEMTGKGFKEVKSPSGIFLDPRDKKITGSVISVMLEGTRPFLLEIQALVTKTVFGYPQRKISGYDLNRLQLLIAVLIKRAGVNLNSYDIILNIAGGFKTSDPAIDLAVCAAIISSLINIAVDRNKVFLGEVGLGGEIRKVNKTKERVIEAKKLGFKSVIAPLGRTGRDGIELVNIKTVSELKQFIA